MLDNRFAPTNLGLGLIVGYSQLNIPLGKPYLRAVMEQDCKLICDGVKDRATVVRDCLREVRQMRAKWIRSLTLIELGMFLTMPLCC